MKYQSYLKKFSNIPAVGIIYLIKGYRYILSPDNGILVKLGIRRAHTCAMYPTCSDYTMQAIERYGAFKGVFWGIKRVFRCHPRQKNNIDLLK